jgi:RNA polymerase sigma-70 factor (ECF subfamily)
MSALVSGNPTTEEVARPARTSRTRRAKATKPLPETGQTETGQNDTGQNDTGWPGGSARTSSNAAAGSGRAAWLSPNRPPGTTSEAELKLLVDRARKGDRFAFDELVRVTWAGTYTLAYRLTGNEEDALDVTQEAYLRALRGLPRFRGEARFSTWLYRVTANCASNHRARSWRSRHDLLDPEGMDEASVRDRRLEHDPEASASAGDERALLEQALLRLPWRLRQVVVLRDVYDLSHKAIAAELDTSEAATKVRLQRARKRLREDLGRRLHGPEAPSRRWRRPHADGKGRSAVTGPDGTNLGAGTVADMDDDAVAS